MVALAGKKQSKTVILKKGGPSGKVKSAAAGSVLIAVVIGAIFLVTYRGRDVTTVSAPSLEIELESAAIVAGEVVLEIFHAGGDNVNLSSLRIMLTDNSGNAFGISGDELTVSEGSGVFTSGSKLTARRQTQFENGTVVRVDIVYSLTGDVLESFYDVTLVENMPRSEVTINGYQILVDGEPFVIKGVCYSPTPVGQGAGYNWWSNSAIYESDFPMIREMGANTIRTYDARNATKEALDAAYRNGLKVIMGYWVDHNINFSNQSSRDSAKTVFTTMVSKWKDHPAVLMWAFGNEVAMNTPYKSGWFTLVRETALATKAIDPNHPFIIIEGDRMGDIGNAEIGSDDATLSALDAWGINSYRGSSFGGLFLEYRTRTNKPIIMTEWGCDALDIRNMEEDQSSQASYIISMWNDIEAELHTGGGICWGGTVFEWCDEWWKGGNSGVHDKTGQWANAAYYDHVAGRNNMNEEWWGITSTSTGTYEKTPREAYYVLKNSWSASAVSEFSMSASPSSGSISGEGTIRLTLRLFSSGGYSNTVSLSAENVPSGVTVEFENGLGVPPFTTSVTITAGPGAEFGTHYINIVGTGSDGKTAAAQFKLKIGIFQDMIIYSDSIVCPSGSVIWVWSGADWGGPAGSFDNSYAGETPPEGTKCFKTASGANWDGNRHVNYAGWGVFYRSDNTDYTVDFSDYNYLKFWVKTPEDLKIEIQTIGNVGGRKYTTYLSYQGWDNTNTWQEIVIPSSTFGSADLSRVFGPFLITVVKPSVTFYVDNVRWTI
ncbi:MAG: cellulase family glycosylhydrolase [Candidatus Hadarchaeales archaeon]